MAASRSGKPQLVRPNCLTDDDRMIDDVITHLFSERPAVDDVRGEVVELWQFESECFACGFVVVVADSRRLGTKTR